MFRHEGTLDDDVLAASAGEPADKPIVDNLVIAFRQLKEGAFIGRLLPRGRDHRAELAPLREIAAARERPLAGESIPALDRDRRPGRRKAGKREGVGVALPQFALRLDRPMRQGIAVRYRAIDGPARRGASRRDRQRNLKRNLAVIFEPAEHSRPAGAQQFRLTDLIDDVWREVA